MSTSKRFDLICIIVTIFALAIAIIFANGEKLGITKIESNDYTDDSTYFSTNDLTTTISSSNKTSIEMNDTEVTIDGNGAAYYENMILIEQGGIYEFSGNLSDGQIRVEADNQSNVWLILDNVNIKNSDNACICILQSKNTYINLKENSTNTLLTENAFSESVSSVGIDGVLFSKDNVTINGNGTLNISGGDKHGIEVNDHMVIVGSTVNVNATSDGIRSNDSIAISDAKLNVTSGDDAIYVEKKKGYIYIESGEFTINAGDDAIHNRNDITINDGSFTINCSDDAIHSESDIIVNGGNIIIETARESFEAESITINDGVIELNSTDDGINASGTSNKLASVNINGGTINIVNPNAQDSDGIDSNGNITFEGGTTRISIVSSGASNAIDIGSEEGGSLIINKGDIVACGAASIAPVPDSSSTNNSILYISDSTLPSNTSISLLDSNSNELVNYVAPCECDYILISNENINLNSSYVLNINGTKTDVNLTSNPYVIGNQEKLQIDNTTAKTTAVTEEEAVAIAAETAADKTDKIVRVTVIGVSTLIFILGLLFVIKRKEKMV